MDATFLLISVFLAGFAFAVGIFVWKRFKFLREVIVHQKELYAGLSVEKTLAEEILLRRTKELHDAQTLLELKVAERVGELQKELSHAKELAKSKDEFIRITSHELRTPLDVVRGNLDMVLKGEAGPVREDMKSYLEDSLLGADRLVRIVNDMLDISRIETGNLKFSFEDFDLVALLGKSVEEFSHIAQKKKVRLTLDAQKKSLIVFSDPEKVIQVLDNVLGNALKFTLRGAIKVSITEKDDFAVVSVKDTGLGVAPEDQPKLFQKFPGIGAPEIKIKGTGLGLYICKELLAKMGGRIWCESKGEDKGATFRFTLPLVSSQKVREVRRLHGLP